MTVNDLNFKKNYYILGQSGVGKTTRIIQSLYENKQSFFYYDCTYDEFLVKTIIQNNKIEKIIFWLVKKIILIIYKNIIIDDIHLLKKSELFTVVEWIEFYKNRLIIISPKCFRFKNEYNHDDYKTVSNIIDKLYDQFCLIEKIVNKEKSMFIGLEQFIKKMFPIKVSVSYRVETSMKIEYNLKLRNSYKEFYNQVSYTIDYIVFEHDIILEDIINMLCNKLWGRSSNNSLQNLKAINNRYKDIDFHKSLLLYLFFIQMLNDTKMLDDTKNNNLVKTYESLLYYISYGKINDSTFLDTPNWLDEGSLDFREAMEHVIGRYEYENEVI